MTRPSLTPHQRETLHTLKRWSNRTQDHWVHGSMIGSSGALEHLVRKGYAEVDIYYGPRNGEHRRYRPKPAGE
jgi:hypothetical protein